MRFNKIRNLIQNQLGNINLSQSLLERPRAMRNHLKELIDENLIGGNFRVPRVNEFLDNDSNQSVELTVYIV